MKLKYSLLAFAAMTCAATAAVSITGSSVTIDGTPYPGDLNGVSLGTFSTSSVLNLDNMNFKASFTNSGGSDNYFNTNPASPGSPIVNTVTLNLDVNGVFSTYSLADPDGGSISADKGNFDFISGDVVNLINATYNTNAPGTYSVDYTISYTYSTFAGGQQVTSATHDQTTGSATFTVVPEPSSAALLGLAGLALVLRRRK